MFYVRLLLLKHFGMLVIPSMALLADFTTSYSPFKQAEVQKALWRFWPTDHLTFSGSLSPRLRFAQTFFVGFYSLIWSIIRQSVSSIEEL
ncbi:hypothetical protein BXZ70DRAFT_533228 [Cristinia sonorae]|uniref:Uncharacterized protein n=1 Tax=Cristinia sonorae TaxID=1940300 RepID=A0A8K0UHD7_9AGAR|nr:hypothetical protein BXZ70DRAFT_533228 [Cristinia sonorae]